MFQLRLTLWHDMPSCRCFARVQPTARVPNKPQSLIGGYNGSASRSWLLRQVVAALLLEEIGSKWQQLRKPSILCQKRNIKQHRSVYRNKATLTATASARASCGDILDKASLRVRATSYVKLHASFPTSGLGSCN